MNLLKMMGQQSISIINDPFKQNKVKRIYVSFHDIWNDGNFVAHGSIEFQNGNTRGEQKFDGATFDEVVLKIKACLETL